MFFQQFLGLLLKFSTASNTILLQCCIFWYFFNFFAKTSFVFNVNVFRCHSCCILWYFCTFHFIFWFFGTKIFFFLVGTTSISLVRGFFCVKYPGTPLRFLYLFNVNIRNKRRCMQNKNGVFFLNINCYTLYTVHAYRRRRHRLKVLGSWNYNLRN